MDFLFLHEPQFPLFRVAAMGLVHGDQTVARGELLALVTACEIATRSISMKTAEFVTDATYVCVIVMMIELGTFKSFLHKMPNSDLIIRLEKVWRLDSFCVRKVKSHRTFQDAKNLNDLWYIAGNFSLTW